MLSQNLAAALQRLNESPKENDVDVVSYIETLKVVCRELDSGRWIAEVPSVLGAISHADSEFQAKLNAQTLSCLLLRHRSFQQ